MVDVDIADNDDLQIVALHPKQHTYQYICTSEQILKGARDNIQTNEKLKYSG